MKKDNIIDNLMNLLLLKDFDFKDHVLLRSVILVTLINEDLINHEDEKLLDFDVVFDGDDPNHITLKSNNLVCSLWFSGIFPDNPWGVHNSGKYKFNNRIYLFNEKTGKMGYKQLKKRSKNE